MKRISFLIAFVSLMLLAFGLAQGDTKITLDNMTGLYAGDTVSAGSAVRWNLRLTFTPGNGAIIRSFSNGFQVWTHQTGVHTDNFSAITYDTFNWGWPDRFDLVFNINPFSIDGMGVDSVGFGGANISAPGIADGTDDLCWWIETTPSVDDDTLCIDSSYYTPGMDWIWTTTAGIYSNDPSYNPIGPLDWSGPHCFHVYDPSSGVKEVEGPDFPTTYSLSQNYPNPFNPSTEIKFDIPVRSHVTLTVYNVLGQKVTTLVDKEMPPGSYVADWNSTSDNGKEVTSGVYFYKLEADDFIKTKKMLLLK